MKLLTAFGVYEWKVEHLYVQNIVQPGKEGMLFFADTAHPRDVPAIQCTLQVTKVALMSVLYRQCKYKYI